MADLLRFVLGAEVDEIRAVTDGQTAARPLEQLACLTLRFGTGTLGQVAASRLLPDSRNDFRVYGITRLIAGHHSMWEARNGRFEITSDTVNETADYPEALLPNYVAEIEDFHRAVATGGEPAAPGLEGLRVVEVTLAMIGSARTRRSQWISVANKACVEGPESATKWQTEQNEDERERRRRLQEATERYKTCEADSAWAGEPVYALRYPPTGRTV